MAQIFVDDENAGTHVLSRSNRKVMGDNASARKMVLSKLDNVMYNNNKPNITPFKGAFQIVRPTSCAPKLSLCKETLQKQHRKQHNNNKNALHPIDGLSKGDINSDVVPKCGIYAKSAAAKDNFDLFDLMDFPSENCLNNCHKPISQNWSEPFLSEDLIDKLLNHSGDSEEEILNNNDVCPYPNLYKIDSELEPIKYKSYVAEDNITDILDIPLPLPIVFDPDFDLF
ncbi:uncharacterized protein LOC117780913 [Drosophila innubila]|uniref:uncharacterized protein LOC117780913 n=1 Tax=Drosophila innubila TaxID=198719 RepID=UPI00148BF64C|nr:uncharacterized protein LOC117780913 [Drosophila innubila]